MAITAPNQPAGTPSQTDSAPVTESPDPKAAKQGGSGEDRPGFDLGGAKDRSAGSADDASAPGSTIIPGGSGSQVSSGTLAAGQAGASGMTDGNGRTLGGTAGGSRPGEATQATPGAVRPPQTIGMDQTSTNGNPERSLKTVR